MKKTILLLCCCLSMVACAQRMADDAAGDDDGQHQPTPDPDPSCRTSADCLDNVACNVGVCRQGTCSYESLCALGEVCDVQADRCETPETPTTDHGISCFQTGSTLYLTIDGKLTDAVYGGSLAHPKYVSVASDQIQNSWNVTSTTSGPRVDLTTTETANGVVSSGSINLPSDQALRFTLLVWSDDSGGYARRLDLSKWDVSGDGCARIADGTTDGSTDGYVIGRAPLCPNACDDGDASTTDVCTATGCTHDGGGTSDPTHGNLSCSDSGSTATVTVSGGVLAHVFNNAGLSPTSSWTIRFGYGGTDYRNWTSDSATYTLSMPNTTGGFNLLLKEPGGTEHWFDVNQFNVSGTCHVGTGEFVHTAGSGGSVGNGALSCSDSGSTTTVTLSNGILAHVFNNAGLSPTSSWTIRFGYGGTDYRYWSTDSATYTLSMPSATSGFNLLLKEPGGTEHWFDVNQFNVSGTCHVGTGEFVHTAGSGSTDGYGTISCSVSGADMTVTINGVLTHTVGGTINPTTSWRLEYGSYQDGWTVPYPVGVNKPYATWVNNSTTYTITMSSSINGFNFALEDGVTPYWLDLNEYVTTGSCYISSGSIYH